MLAFAFVLLAFGRGAYELARRVRRRIAVLAPVVVLVVYTVMAGPITRALVEPEGCPDCMQSAGLGYLVIWLALATVTIASFVARSRQGSQRESPAARPSSSSTEWTVRGHDR
jgi:hypothetical protein